MKIKEKTLYSALFIHFNSIRYEYRSITSAGVGMGVSMSNRVIAQERITELEEYCREKIYRARDLQREIQYLRFILDPLN